MSVSTSLAPQTPINLQLQDDDAFATYLRSHLPTDASSQRVTRSGQLSLAVSMYPSLPSAALISLARTLTEQEFYVVIQTAPEFTREFNIRLRQAVALGGGAATGAGAGALAGFILGPIGAAVGAVTGAAAGVLVAAVASGVRTSDRTILQLIGELSAAQRTELWQEVQSQLSRVTQGAVSAEVVRSHSGLVVDLIQRAFSSYRPSSDAAAASKSRYTELGKGS